MGLSDGTLTRIDCPNRGAAWRGVGRGGGGVVEGEGLGHRGVRQADGDGARKGTAIDLDLYEIKQKS